MSYCSAFDASSLRYCLTDLTISELLTLKHSLIHFGAMKEFDHIQYKKELNTKCTQKADKACENPSAMALVAEENRGFEDSHTSYELWKPEEKPSKLQTLFQISVTALAFLSFGGYLLCLIVQSIKSKGTTFFHPIASTMATTNGMKRIKVYRRTRRSLLPPIDNTQNYYFFNQQYNYNTKNPYHYYKLKYRNF